MEPATQMRKGSRLVVGFGSRAAEFEVLELTVPNSFGWIERKGRPGNHLYFSLAFSGGSTILGMKAILQSPGLWGRLFGEILRRQDAKRVCEGVGHKLQRIVTQ